MQPAITVIIPVYNRKERLQKAIESVLAQTVQPLEIIVVNDGSTDGTADWLKRSDLPITVLTQENRGVSAARNLGIAQANGEWVALLDSDDEWLPVKLEQQCSVIEDDTVLVHSDEIWIRNGVRVNPHKKHQKHGGWIFEHCLQLCAISPSAAVIRKTLLKEIGGFDESLPACEDYDLWLRICAEYPVVYVDKALVVKHGGHEDQLSRKYWGMDRFRVTSLEKLLQNRRLDAEQRTLVIQTLSAKLSILMNGAEKRQRLESRDYWREKLDSVQRLANA